MSSRQVLVEVVMAGDQDPDNTVYIIARWGDSRYCRYYCLLLPGRENVTQNVPSASAFVPKGRHQISRGHCAPIGQQLHYIRHRNSAQAALTVDRRSLVQISRGSTGTGGAELLLVSTATWEN